MEVQLKYRLFPLVLIIAFLISPFTVGSQPQEVFGLNDISLNKSDVQVEVILELSNKIDFESFTLFNPNRLVLDLFGVSNIPSNPFMSVNSMGIKSMRTALNQPEVARFIIDFEDNIPQYSIDQSGNNIIIILKSEVEQPVQKEEEEAIIQEETPQIEAPAVETPVLEAPASKPTVQEQKEVKEPAQKKSEIRKEARKKKKEDRQSKEPKSTSDKKTSIAFGPETGIYSLQSQDFKDIYGKSVQFYGAEFDFLFILNQTESIGAALSFDYLSDTGKMTLTQEEVKLTLLPLSLSFVYKRNFGKFNPYVALGIEYFKYQETLPESFPNRTISGFLWGYNFQLGIHFKLEKFISIRAFFKYHVAKKTENDSLIDFSGLQFGVGAFYLF